MLKRLLIILLMLLPILDKANLDSFPENKIETDSYSIMHLSDMGMSYSAYQLALKGFNKLKAEGKLLNQSVLTIIDFSQSSNKKRLYVIDLINKTLLFNTYVAHGRNTGEEFAEKFSNESGTYKSSLGFYITKNLAIGSKVGLSLILQGIDKGFNDKALQREIIMHGADLLQKNL